MLRPQYAIELSVEERQQIEALLRAGKTQQRVAKRAAALLLADQGMNNQAIADELVTSRHWVQKWRKRFAPYAAKSPPPGQEADRLMRMQALEDLPRSGRPPGFSPSVAPPGSPCGLSGGARARLQRFLPL
jgi:hypothetical protein